MKAPWSLAVAFVATSAAAGPEVGGPVDWLTPGAAGLTSEMTATTPKQRTPELEIDVPEDLGLWGEARFRLARVELLGATVLDATAVEALLAQYRNRDVTMSELQRLREALSRMYLEAGYVSSGVIIPDQEIIDGVVHLQAIEGTLTDARIRTDRRLREAYVSGRVRRRISGPLDIDALQDTLVLLQNDPRIERVDAELAPGEARGESVLHLSVTEASPWLVGLSFDNHRAESIGAERGRLSLGHGNVSGRGDALALSLDTTRGSDAGAISYTLPLAANDASLRLYASMDDSQVLDAPFDDLDIESRTDSYGLRLALPILESLRSDLMLSLGLERRSTVTRLLGTRFSLSPGAIDGESAVAAAILGVDYVRREEDQALALRGTIRRGLDVLDATDANDAANLNAALLDADGQFTLALLQGQYVRQLGVRDRITVRATAQLTDDPLLAPEKLSIGGVNTVRGYRENLLVRDNGIAATLEWAHSPFPADAPRWQRTLRLVAFADYGLAWDVEDTAPGSSVRDTAETKSILGLGFGLLWAPIDGLMIAAYKGFDAYDSFRDREDPRDSGSNAGLQNEGIHLSVAWQRRF